MNTEKPKPIQIMNEHDATTEHPTLVEILRNSPLVGLDVDFSRQDDEIQSLVFDETVKND